MPPQTEKLTPPQLGKTDAPQTRESIQTNPFKQKKNRQLALAVLGASWLPIASHNRTEVTVIAGSVFLRVSRFATFARTA